MSSIREQSLVKSIFFTHATCMVKADTSKPLALLIHPPVYDFAFYDLFAKPFALCRIGAVLKRAGYQVDLVNALDYRDTYSVRLLGKPKRKNNGTGKMFRTKTAIPEIIKQYEAAHNRNYCRYGIHRNQLQHQMKKQKPQVILISSGMTYWYPGVVEVVETAKNLFPDVPVIVGGVYATLMARHCTHLTSADYVVSSAAFPALWHILNKLGLPPYNQGDGFHNDDFNDRFYDSSVDDNSESSTCLLLQKNAWLEAGVVRLHQGCPMQCRYCASSLLSGMYKEGDHNKTYAIIRDFYTKLGITNIAFYDDALLTKKDTQFKLLLKRIINDSKFKNEGNGMKLSFYLPNGIHIEMLDQETAVLMKQAGFKDVRLGYESSSADFHQKYHSKYTPEYFCRAVENLKKAGFENNQIIAYVLAGLPNQPWQEVETSIRQALKLNIIVSISEYSPVPNSGLWCECIEHSKYPLEKEPLFHNNTLFPLEWEGFTRSDLNRLKILSRTNKIP